MESAEICRIAGTPEKIAEANDGTSREITLNPNKPVTIVTANAKYVSDDGGSTLEIPFAWVDEFRFTEFDTNGDPTKFTSFINDSYLNDIDFNYEHLSDPEKNLAVAAFANMGVNLMYFGCFFDAECALRTAIDIEESMSVFNDNNLAVARMRLAECYISLDENGYKYDDEAGADFRQKSMSEFNKALPIFESLSNFDGIDEINEDISEYGLK